MQILSDSFMRSWPMYSSSVCGRKACSMVRSSSVNWAFTIRSLILSRSLGPASRFLRSRNISRRRRQGALSWDCRVPAIRRADLAPLRRVRHIQFHLFELALREPPPILVTTASRYRRTPHLTIPFRARSAHRQHVRSQRDALDQRRIPILTNSRRLSHAGCGIAIGALPASLANAFRPCRRILSTNRNRGEHEHYYHYRELE